MENLQNLNAWQIVLQIVGTLGMAILGMLMVAWVNANNSPKTGKFSIEIFWRDNAEGFLWAVIGMAILITILCIEPKASEVLGFVGFKIEIPIKGAGAIVLGGFFYDNARKRFKSQK